MEILIWLGKLTWFFLPAGFANMAPVLVQHHFKSLAIPIDGGRKLWGKRLLGDHKTWRGLLAATGMGGIVFWLQWYGGNSWGALQQLSIYPYSEFPSWFGLLFGFGAIVGDAIKSFFKRQFKIADGQSWFPFDQLDFYIGATLMLCLFQEVDALVWFAILAVGPSLHILVNRAAFHLKLKDTPW